MTQTALDFTRPKPDALFKRGSQNCRVYERLLAGPVDNGELPRKMFINKYTSRISDIRKALRPYLMDVRADADPIDRSRVVYRLVG
ncbi:MAG: hypothetical protein WC262_10845 [Bacteroidales bacterium]|jgi:hypothetical protein|nr:hypothetical protein [Syntrophales bacterium]